MFNDKENQRSDSEPNKKEPLPNFEETIKRLLETPPAKKSKPKKVK